MSRVKPFVAIGLLVLAVLFVSPWMTSVDPLKLSVMDRLKPPSALHPFGTDDFGRDVFARVAHGARLSLIIGFLVTAVATLLGTAIGLAAGFFRRADPFLARLLDAMMAFPDILLAVALMAAFGQNLGNVVIALGLVYAPRVARVVRASTLAQRGMLFVEAAESMGAGRLRILLLHVLPNILPVLFVQATFVFAYALLTESALSFLGVGVPPEVPTLGNMIAAAQLYFDDAAWLILFPGAAIALAVLCLQMVGDGLRDALDPILRGAE
ncbi:ABC transporter permease [Roseomonas sp. AR75]|uniref:ABC transporter permease n=1 Tax=Roseomonas sp. AR75 TaxID=2562311 RepID=UPI001F114D85|nr:ABC transporter permease [Roseomonas sp. AR75]